MLHATQLAAKLKAEMETIKNAMVEPGHSDFAVYREQLVRYHAFKDALEKLRLTIDEDEETAT